MQNLLDFLKDVLSCSSVMHRYQFNQFFINIKFLITDPDEDCKLYYSSDVNDLIDNNITMFEFEWYTIEDISSIHSTTDFLVNEMSLSNSAFSVHTISNVFFIIFTQPLRSVRIWHKVNFLRGV